MNLKLLITLLLLAFADHPALADLYEVVTTPDPISNVQLSPDASHLLVTCPDPDRPIYIYNSNNYFFNLATFDIINLFEGHFPGRGAFRRTRGSSPVLLLPAADPRIVLMNPFNKLIEAELDPTSPTEVDVPAISSDGQYAITYGSWRFSTWKDFTSLETDSRITVNSVFDPFRNETNRQAMYPNGSTYFIVKGYDSDASLVLDFHDADQQLINSFMIPQSPVLDYTERGALLLANGSILDLYTGLPMHDPFATGITDITSLGETGRFVYSPSRGVVDLAATPPVISFPQFTGLSRVLILEDLDRVMFVRDNTIAICRLGRSRQSLEVRSLTPLGRAGQFVNDPIRIVWNADRWLAGTGFRIELLDEIGQVRHTLPEVWSEIAAGIAFIDPAPGQLEPGRYQLRITSLLNPTLSVESESFVLTTHENAATVWHIYQ